MVYLLYDKKRKYGTDLDFWTFVRVFRIVQFE